MLGNFAVNAISKTIYELRLIFPRKYNRWYSFTEASKKFEFIGK